MSSQLQVSGEAKIRDIQGPVVANSGVITALDGAASQYVRGDGTLADFPTSSGGGSSVSYYLNSSVSQGTIGGVAYRELSKDPIIGAGTDITISANGYVANYITDANDPDVTIVPGGNFNCEFYFSVNNNTGNPTTYAELYKYDGTTFTLLGTSAGVPESINQGTTIAPYYFAIPVATASLSVTDRLAIRIYVNVSGRTVTLHTENGHLCQVVTTLSKGMVSLNNLTDQSQYLATGTSGTNFNIVSSGDTHTFNLPVASATNTGKLSSTDWSTFNGKVPYTGAISDVNLGTYSITGGIGTFTNGVLNGNGTNPANLYLKKGSAPFFTNANNYGLIAAVSSSFILISDVDGANYKYASFNLGSLTNNTNRAYTLPDITGTLALLEGTQTFSGVKTFTQSPISEGGYSFKILASGTLFGNGYSVISSLAGNVSISQAISAGNLKAFTFDFSAWATNTTRTYTLPNASGTIALTSDLSAYLPLTGGTLTGNLTINPSTTDYTLTVSTSSTNNTIKLLGSTASNTSTIGYWSSNGGTGYGALNFTPTNTRFEIVNGGSFSIYTSGNERLTIAANGAMTLASNVTTTGSQFVQNGFYLTNSNGGATAGYTNMWGADDGIFFGLRNATGGAKFVFQSATSYNYTFPAATGTLALTSNLSAYLPLTGGTLTGALSGTSATFSGNSFLATSSGNVGIGTSSPIYKTHIVTANNTDGLVVTTNANDTETGLYIRPDHTNGIVKLFATGGTNKAFGFYNGNTLALTIASNGAATFSSSVTATIGTFSSAGGGIYLNEAGANAGAGFIQFQSQGVQKWNLATGTNNDLLLYNNGGTNSYNIVVKHATGNVGIGTGSPSNKLDIQNGSDFDIRLRDTSLGGTVGILFETANDFSGTSQAYIKGIGAGSNGTSQLIFGTAGSSGDTTATERMRITSGGNVLIGTTSNASNYKFVVSSNAWIPQYLAMGVNDDGRYIGQGNIISGAFQSYDLTIVNYATSGRVTITNGSNGVVLNNGATSWSAFSDERLKNINGSIENAVDKLMSIRAVNFSWKTDETNKENLGLIAQDVQKVFPEVIDESKSFNEGDDTEYLSVKYTELIPVLVKAIQEQQEQIEELKQLIKNK